MRKIEISEMITNDKTLYVLLIIEQCDFLPKIRTFNNTLCFTSKKEMIMNNQYNNELQNSTSPYLLQHAHNPVNWVQWSDEVITRAKNENKLILVSIGYAACHWCHVMAHESFEDTEVAEVMNQNFICVKVDREERPDVDHYYMSALQLMQIQGGWPLNVIALPDGKPIWGGTYFPKETWIKSLNAVYNFYQENKDKAQGYAANLQQGLEQVFSTKDISKNEAVSIDKIKNAVSEWKSRFDYINGGRKGQPKFPMPVNLDFLLYFGHVANESEVLKFVFLTLLKMARGGIYDQVGGGFARYSVDELWKVPHFEKMLYDNGQLLSIYSKAYQLVKEEELKTVVYETVSFLEREMLDKSGAFYSSLDADSEGEEGRFYIWTAEELKSVLKKDYELFAKYYHVNELGLWEDGQNILLRTGDDQSFASEHQLQPEELQQKIGEWKNILLERRSKRVRPGLDDKTLTSWNALVIQGLTDAYKAFNDKHILQLALKNALFLEKNLMQADGKLFHNWKKGKATINGFFEDYSYLIQAFISLFEITGDEKWLHNAEKLTKYTFTHFYDKNSGLYFFSEIDKNNTIINHKQNEDNVTPASNSVMANNLFRLGLIMGDPGLHVKAEKMVQHFSNDFMHYPMAYANWGNLMLKRQTPFYEVAICGSNAKSILQEMQEDFYPNVLWAISTGKSDVPLLKERFVVNSDLIYVCSNGVCQLPVNTIKEAVKIMK